VTDSVVLARATAKDEADIRRLLRENPLGGGYSVSFEREPSAFLPGLEQNFVLARDRATNEAIGLYEHLVWPAFVNGAVRRLPYLGGLRVARSHRNRISILRRGYASIREWFADPDHFPIALTSITADNEPATRILTAGLKGLPIYLPFGDFATYLLRPVGVPPHPNVAVATEDDLPELAAFLNRRNADFQFGQHWPVDRLKSLGALGLPSERFLLFRCEGRLAGCVALWDQSGYKQSRVRGYPRMIRAVRPLANVLAPLLRVPRLPAIGERIDYVTLSHLAVEDDNPDVFLALLGSALVMAKRLGFSSAVLGFSPERALRTTLLARYRAIEYRTILYLVHWPEAEEAAASCLGRVPHPEIALL
jgi:hypothetical protein